MIGFAKKIDSTKILLIEDNETDALMVEESLKQVGEGGFAVKRTKSLQEGLGEAVCGTYDIILLDLNLPDAIGLEGVEMCRNTASETPLLVLTGSKDEDTALRAVQLGAQDFLVKTHLQPIWLARSILYAIERQRLLKAIEHEHMERQHERERELSSMELLSTPPGTRIAAGYYGTRPVREGQPKIFQRFVQTYEEFLDEALENRIYKANNGEGGGMHEKLRDLGVSLGRLRCGPRDVVEVHSTAIKNKTRGVPPPKVKAYMEEGRLIVLEVMGYLADFYRNYYIPYLANRRDASMGQETRTASNTHP